MYKKILVAMDNSDTSEFVFEHAIMLAQAYKARLKLLHISLIRGERFTQVEQPSNLCTYTGATSNLTPSQTSNSSKIDSESDLLERLDAYTERAKTLEIDTAFKLGMGDPGQVICDLALAWHAKLILMGGKGWTSQSRHSQNNVRNFVTDNAPCSVQVVRLQSDPVLSASSMLENKTLLAHLAG